jgi:hypothetical protein
MAYSSTYKFLVLFTIGLAFAGCKDDFKPEDSFIKVYDDQDINKDYFPISIKRTSDDGYLTISAFNGSQIHLLKTDALGDLLWEFDLPSNYISAVPNLIERNGDLYFVCMDAVGLFTYIMKVDETAESAVEYQVHPDILYPLYVADNGNEVYIENYERTSMETGIFELNASMDQMIDSTSVEIFVDVEEIIADHLNYTGKRFPFFISLTPEQDHIVMNGFNNYSFSTVFLNTDMTFSGVYSGAAFDGAIKSILPLGGNQFSLARFSFTDLYVNPNATLSPTTIDIAEAIPSEWNSELDAESPVLIRTVSINSSEYVVYLATTKSNQLFLNAYVAGTNELAGTKYLGESVPLKACDFTGTADGGMMILTQARIMSSFDRIATIKLSKEELESLVE